jgi:hypothetical protein
MKKRAILVILVLLAAFFLTVVSADSPEDVIQQKADSLENTKDKIQDVTSGEIKPSYLSEEWTKALKNNPNTNWIYKLNPLFKFLFGYEFALSWAFVTAVLLWTILFSFLYPPTKLMFNNTLTALAISLLISAITCQIASQRIINIIAPHVRDIWSSIGTIFLLVVGSILAQRVSRMLIVTYKKRRAEKKLAKLEEEVHGSNPDIATIKSVKEGVENITKGYKDYKDKRK